MIFSKDGEIEYSVMTPLVSVSMAQNYSRIRKHWPTVMTELEFLLTLPRPVNGTWNVTCATAAKLTSHQWDVSSCQMDDNWTPSSNVTRCHCPSVGLFAILARVVPKVSIDINTTFNPSLRGGLNTLNIISMTISVATQLLFCHNAEIINQIFKYQFQEHILDGTLVLSIILEI